MTKGIPKSTLLRGDKTRPEYWVSRLVVKKNAPNEYNQLLKEYRAKFNALEQAASEISDSEICLECDDTHVKCEDCGQYYCQECLCLFNFDRDTMPEKVAEPTLFRKIVAWLGASSRVN